MLPPIKYKLYLIYSITSKENMVHLQINTFNHPFLAVEALIIPLRRPRIRPALIGTLKQNIVRQPTTRVIYAIYGAVLPLLLA